MDLVREKTLPQMRVGIVTFSAAYNYGAALQCRCLLEVLRGLGLEAYVLDYRPAYLTEPYKILKPYYFKKLSILLSLPWRFWGAWRRDRLFRQFHKTLSPVPFGAGGVDAVFFGALRLNRAVIVASSALPVTVSFAAVWNAATALWVRLW